MREGRNEMTSKFSRNNIPQPTPIICKAPPPDMMPPIYPPWMQIQVAWSVLPGSPFQEGYFGWRLRQAGAPPNIYFGDAFVGPYYGYANIDVDAPVGACSNTLHVKAFGSWVWQTMCLDVIWHNRQPFYGTIRSGTPGWSGSLFDVCLEG